MPQMTSGMIVKCDPALKEFIKHLNQKKQFIIEDLDSTTLLIFSEMKGFLQQEIEELNKKNTYEPPIK